MNSRLFSFSSRLKLFSPFDKVLSAIFMKKMSVNGLKMGCTIRTRSQRESIGNRKYSTESNTYNKTPKINLAPRGVLITLLFSLGAYITYLWIDRQKQLAAARERLETLLDSDLGQLNWQLTDQLCKRRDYSEFRGKWLMIYFGFCHCPDICPEELEKLVSVVEGLDEAKGVPKIQPIFITLDPERDTASFMEKYCKDFSEKLIGLTGTVDEIAAAAKSYRVYYGYGEKDEDGDYIVDHTICMYLVNPEGYLVDVYERRATVPGIVSGTMKRMKENVALNLPPLPQQPARDKEEKPS